MASVLTRPTTMVSTRPMAAQPNSARTMGTASRITGNNCDSATQFAPDAIFSRLTG